MQLFAAKHCCCGSRTVRICPGAEEKRSLATRAACLPTWLDGSCFFATLHSALCLVDLLSPDVVGSEASGMVGRRRADLARRTSPSEGSDIPAHFGFGRGL